MNQEILNFIGQSRKVIVCGGPCVGKSTLAKELQLCLPVQCTDDLIPLGWSGASSAAADWFKQDRFLCEGVAISRALRKALEQGIFQRGTKIVRLTEPKVELTPGQRTMLKGEATVWNEIAPQLLGLGASMIIV